MKTKAEIKNRSWIQLKAPSLIRAVLLLLILAAANTAVRASVVTNCTEADLRAAMAGGGTVTFACDGTITLAATITNATDTMLDASGHQITISGGDAVRVFYVNTNTTFALANLTIANGRSENGGGIYIAGGTVNTTNCIFSRNGAYGHDAPDLMDHTMGTNGCGAAIYNTGILRASRCSFMQNTAGGGHGSTGPPGSGITSGQGGFGGDGGAAKGGAICNLGTIAIDSSLFASNTATGGAGGRGGNGASSPSILEAGSGGGGGRGGSGHGGAVFNAGGASLVNCSFAWNHGRGASGGHGGNGGTYYTSSGPFYFWAGAGGAGGDAGGGIYSTNGIVRLTNCTVAFNSGFAGSGGIGGLAGNGNPASGGSGGIAGSALKGLPAELSNSLLASNSPGSNGSGRITDAGHNLSSDSSCAFTNVGSLNNTDPLLGPLTNNGGPTLTMALLPGSPAIDAGDDSAAPPTDQRGFNRPAGAASDIGAFEFGAVAATAPVITAPPLSQTANAGTTAYFSVGAVGAPPLSYQWFFNLSDVIPDATNALLQLTNVQVFQMGAYRVVISNSYGAVTSSLAMLKVVGVPPTLDIAPGSQTSELGFTARFTCRGTGSALSYQWFCDGIALAGCTNCMLCLPDLRASHVGVYTVAISNAGGSVTSAPAMLSVIPPVPRRPVPALYLSGEAGSSLNLDYTEAADSATDWLWLDRVNMTSSPQLYLDLTSPLPSHRFYRAWQSGSPAVLPSLSLPAMVPAITLTGGAGSNVRLDYINVIGPTDAWVTLDTVTLTNTSQLYVDVSAVGQPARLYRIVPVP